MINKNEIVMVSAGFPSPADNYVEEGLNINKYIVKNKESTFFVRVSGDSMINVGIFDHDILVVDRSLIPTKQAIVVASIDGELVVKKLMKNKLLTIRAADNIVRILPPLNVKKSELNLALNIINKV